MNQGSCLLIMMSYRRTSYQSTFIFFLLKESHCINLNKSEKLWEIWTTTKLRFSNSMHHRFLKRMLWNKIWGTVIHLALIKMSLMFMSKLRAWGLKMINKIQFQTQLQIDLRSCHLIKIQIINPWLKERALWLTVQLICLFVNHRKHRTNFLMNKLMT